MELCFKLQFNCPIGGTACNVLYICMFCAATSQHSIELLRVNFDIFTLRYYLYTVYETVISENLKILIFMLVMPLC